jgi:uncharacterized membrane protein
MKDKSDWMSKVIIGLPLMALLAFSAVRYSIMSSTLVAASIGLFLLSAWAARELLGVRLMAVFISLALAVGWFAEEIGASRGWFFGRYSYTDVLGPRLGSVPLVIPLMWFALCFIGYVMAQFLLWRQPDPVGKSLMQVFLTSLLAAMLVTAFDLGADPYFVFVLKAWVMQKTDGGWFGETLQGFAGWMLISFLIVLSFQLIAKNQIASPTKNHLKLAMLLPIGIYLSAMLFQILFGHPVETRAVALFSMGIPTLIALVAWWQWKEGEHS